MRSGWSITERCGESAGRPSPRVQPIDVALAPATLAPATLAPATLAPATLAPAT